MEGKRNLWNIGSVIPVIFSTADMFCCRQILGVQDFIVFLQILIVCKGFVTWDDCSNFLELRKETYSLSWKSTFKDGVENVEIVV